MHRLITASLVLVVALAGAGCGDDETDTPTSPTPERPRTTETFSGRVTVNGAASHPFAATGSGEIALTLTTLAPDAAAWIGLSLGTWNVQTGSCQIVLANDNATQGSLVLGNAGAAGTFCARVYDVGQLSEPAEYTLTVVHF